MTFVILQGIIYRKFNRKNCLQLKMYNVNIEKMNAIFKTIGLTAVASILICGSADAQRHYRHHHHFYYPQRIVTVVARPATTVRISNRLNQKERFQMAIAYLEHNQYLSVKKYAKMTGLSKDMAEAELDAFACDKKNPVALVISDRKKLYTKR